MDSWLESASHLSAYRQEQGFAIARLPLQASGNDHKPQRHDSGCHRQEPSKALVNKVVSASIESSPYDNDSMPQGNSAKTHVGVWMQRSSPQWDGNERNSHVGESEVGFERNPTPSNQGHIGSRRICLDGYLSGDPRGAQVIPWQASPLGAIRLPRVHWL